MTITTLHVVQPPPPRRPKRRGKWRGKWRTLLIIAGVLSLLGAANGEAIAAAVHQYEINTASYNSAYGHWDEIDLPNDVQVNAIHAAQLSTGKILIVAGSGNDTTKVAPGAYTKTSYDASMFAPGTFRSLLYDPVSGETTPIETPSDMFCAGQTMLPNGDMLVAGGTQRYEDLTPKHAGGVMTVKNENPDNGITFPKGTEFEGPTGQLYKTDSDVIVAPAAKTPQGDGSVKVTASATNVWVDAEAEGDPGKTDQPGQYTIKGLSGNDAKNLYGMNDAMTLDKHDFEGDNKAYVFDPIAEKYTRVGDMNEKRWYPTLTGLPNGEVMATSGLDGNGRILQGQTEVYDPATKVWTAREDLTRYFPTYPAIFQTGVANRLFYSGSNAGYGPADKGRDPGLWNLSNNTFTTVPDLRDPDLMETSSSAWVGPVQNQTIMVVGGGGVGDVDTSTGRIDTIKLDVKDPYFTPGPSLPEGTRYPSVVTLPDDTSLITGGSAAYRGKHGSDNHTARIYHPGTNTLSVAADPSVGRDYHSEALLMPDGRVITLGSNPLFNDQADTEPGTFEQRIEIYTPPYLFHGARPEITQAPGFAQLGDTMVVTSPQAGDIVSARLMRPSAVTHVTDVEQRSVALGLTHTEDGLTLSVPAEPALVPPGYYMLFLVDSTGIPSVAKWVQVGSTVSTMAGMPGMGG